MGPKYGKKTCASFWGQSTVSMDSHPRSDSLWVTSAIRPGCSTYKSDVYIEFISKQTNLKNKKFNFQIEIIFKFRTLDGYKVPTQITYLYDNGIFPLPSWYSYRQNNNHQRQSNYKIHQTSHTQLKIPNIATQERIGLFKKFRPVDPHHK